MTRQDLAAVCALGLGVAAFFGPALFGDRAVFPWNMDLWHPWAASASAEDLSRPSRLPDSARQFAVMRELSDGAIVQGRIPLWNRWIYSGTPFLANFQPGVFYPPNLVLARSGLSLPERMTAGLAFHLLLGVSGLYALMRGCGLRPAASLLGAIVFGWSGYNASRTGIPTMVASAAWLPWALLAARRWLRAPSSGAFLGMASSLALSGLAGFAQIFVFSVYAFGLFVLVHARRGLRRWSGVLGAGTVAALLVGVHLVPALELRDLSRDASHGARTLASGALHPLVLTKLVAPAAFGHPADGTNATHLLETGDGHFVQTERSTAVYVGVLPLLLGLVALLSPGDHRRVALAGLLLAGLGLLFSLPTPLLGLAPHLPGLSFSRPDRAVFLWCTGMAMLAAIGAARMGSGEGPGMRRNACRIAVLGGALAVILAGAIAAAGPSLLPERIVAHAGPGAVRRAGLAALAVATASTALVLLRALDRLGPRAFLGIALALTGLDLGVYAARRNVLQPKSSVFRLPLEGGALEFLRRRAEESGPFRVLSYEPFRSPYAGVLPPSTAAVYGIEDALGFDSLNLARYADLVEAIDPAMVIRRGNFRGATFPEAFGSPIVDLLNVRYVLARPGDAVPGLPLVHRSDLWVHENPRALPRAFLVGEARAVEDSGARVAELSSAGFQPGSVALLDAPVEGMPSRPGEAGSARVVRHEGERVEIRVDPARSALLVVAEAWAPGWEASVDGENRPVHRADHALRGVLVHPGEELVVLTYRPRSFRAGAALSLAGLLALGAGALAAGRARGSSP